MIDPRMLEGDAKRRYLDSVLHDRAEFYEEALDEFNESSGILLSEALAIVENYVETYGTDYPPLYDWLKQSLASEAPGFHLRMAEIDPSRYIELRTCVAGDLSAVLALFTLLDETIYQRRVERHDRPASTVMNPRMLTGDAKKRYLAAILCDRGELYEEKIDQFDECYGILLSEALAMVENYIDMFGTDMPPDPDLIRESLRTDEPGLPLRMAEIDPSRYAELRARITTDTEALISLKIILGEAIHQRSIADPA